jgi:hypothetical protein
MPDLLATDTDLAAKLQRDVDTASAILALEIGTSVVQNAAEQRIVRVTDDTITLWGTSDQLLRLPEHPVGAVTSVTYAGQLLPQGTESGSWRRTTSGLWRDIGWTDGIGEPSEVIVVYTHGLLPDAQAIQYARGQALAVAANLFTNPDGTQRERIDDYEVAYAQAEADLESSGAARRLRRQYRPRRSIRFV